MGVLHVAYGLLVLVLALAFYGFGYGADNPDSRLTLHRLGEAAAVPVALAGIAYVGGGVAFGWGGGRARTLMWVLSVLALGSVPVGTALGIYSVWVLSRRS